MASLDTLQEEWLEFDLLRWVRGGITATDIAFPAPGSGVTWNSLLCYSTPLGQGNVRSAASWDLTDSGGIAVPVTLPATFPGAVEVVLSSQPDPDDVTGDALWWTVGNGRVLQARYRIGGVDELDADWFTVATLDHSAQDHAWWRIRHRDGLVLWELSPDGIAWTTAGAWFPTFDVTALYVSLRLEYSDPDDGDPIASGPAAFGPVNLLPERPEDPATIHQQEGVPYLAVDVQPDNLTGTFLVGDALENASWVDGEDRLGWSATAAGSWENVVCDVQVVRFVRGVSELAGPLTVVDAGLLTVVLSDTGRRFDPLENADAIHVGTPIRVRAWGWDLAGDYWEAVLITGTIGSMPVRYLPDDPPEVTVTATDLVTELVESTGPGELVPIGSGDNLLTRAQRVLEYVGLPATRLALDVDVTAYAVSHPATPMARPWDELVAAQEAELGRLWVDRDNRLVVRTRGSELSGPVRGTVSDVHGDADPGTVHCCYEDLDATHGTDEVVNRAVGTRREPDSEAPTPATLTAEDTASVARWRARVAERTLELETDAQVADWAEYLVAAAGTPGLRVRSVAPHPPRDDVDTALDAWPAVCSTDLGDRWVTRYHPARGPIVDRTVAVLGIAHEVTPEDWRVTFVTADATPATPGNPLGLFIVDDSDVDAGDALAPHTAEAAGWVIAG
jgi:hypothetical protein